MALPAQQRQKPRRDTAEECLLVIALSMLGLRSRAMRPRPSVCKSGKDEVVALNVGLVARNAGLALSLADRSSRDPRWPLYVETGQADWVLTLEPGGAGGGPAEIRPGADRARDYSLKAGGDIAKTSPPHHSGAGPFFFAKS